MILGSVGWHIDFTPLDASGAHSFAGPVVLASRVGFSQDEVCSALAIDTISAILQSHTMFPSKYMSSQVTLSPGGCGGAVTLVRSQQLRDQTQASDKHCLQRAAESEGLGGSGPR